MTRTPQMSNLFVSITALFLSQKKFPGTEHKFFLQHTISVRISYETTFIFSKEDNWCQQNVTSNNSSNYDNTCHRSKIPVIRQSILSQEKVHSSQNFPVTKWKNGHCCRCFFSFFYFILLNTCRQQLVKSHYIHKVPQTEI